MKTPPTPRQGVYELYWYFAAERQAIFERRLQGLPRPWTKDPTLQEYKFCNVYRAADRVSQYMIQQVACNAEFAGTDDQLFQVAAFRTFSREECWEELRAKLGGYPTLAHLRSGKFLEALDDMKAKGKRLYTGAFILCANKAFGHSQKHRNHTALFRKMFIVDRLATRLRNAKSLQEIYTLLHGYPLMGDFMSYQTAIDLNYSNQINFSENDFCQAGPGALRGLKKAFTSLGDYTPAQTVRWMVERQQEEFKKQGLKFNGLFGRALHAIDAQGLFCELDKYCRQAVPSLKSARTRIKIRFEPTPRPLSLGFPPKWGLKTTS